MIEMAQSVTLSGQVVIQWIERKINEFVSKKTGLEKDRIVLIDTDSVVIDLEDLVNQVCPEHYTREQRLDFLIKFGEKVMDPYIDHCYQEFAEYINAFQQKMHMKRENVISRMISVAKKMYCMEVYNSEGKQFSVDDPYMKIMGLKLVKSDTPAVMRQALRKALPILLQKSEAEVQDYVEEVRKTFGQYTVEEIAFPKTANNVSAYDRKIVERLYENTTDKTVTWSSSESSIAGVDDNGTVTAVSAGTAVITATTVNGRTAECTVTVQAAPMIGDYFYSDGTWSTELDENKTPVGLVFYIGDITAEDAALATEYPGCTHGLVVSLNNTNADGTTWQENYAAYGKTVNEWVEGNSDYAPVNSADKANGYNNTKAIEAFNADPANSGWPVEAVQEIVNFRGSHPVENTSDWYLPSAKEWMLLSAGQFEGDVMDVYSTANLDIINGLLGSISGAEKIEGMNMGPFSIPGSFWSSTEHSLEIELSYSSGGNITTDLYKSGALAKVRPILAF